MPECFERMDVLGAVNGCTKNPPWNNPRRVFLWTRDLGLSFSSRAYAHESFPVQLLPPKNP